MVRLKTTCVGFTGTRRGLTAEQHTSLRAYLSEKMSRMSVFHHGCCVGADAAAAALVAEVLPTVVIEAHPCTIRSMTDAASIRLSTVIHPTAPPLDRNKTIVDRSDILIACPGGPNEERRSGTWYTVRYARRTGKPITFVWPDGSCTNHIVART